MAQRAGDSKPSTYRERHRRARRQEFLDTAREIVNRDGLDALTMQRVTAEVGSSAGGIYIYFPTKAALLGELQKEALEVLAGAFRDGQAKLDAMLEGTGVSTKDAALARVLAGCRFWIESEDTLPAEIEVSRRVIARGKEPANEMSPAALPALLGLLQDGQQIFDGAVAAGQLDPGNGIERSVTIISALTGVLHASKLGGFDSELFDGHRLGRSLIDDILVGWGADRAALAAAAAHLPELD